MLAYKLNADDAVERLSDLWSRQAQDRVFAHTPIPTTALRHYLHSHTDGPTCYPDPEKRIRFWDAHLAETAQVEDDWLPIAYLSEFDQGIYAASVGAPIHYMMHSDIGWVSSMTPPILEDISRVGELRIDPDADIIRLLDQQLRVYAEAARGRFGVAPFIVIDAMNFVSELRGATRAFEDTFDHPEETRWLMDFAFDLNVFIQKRVYDALDRFAGGSFVNMGSWAPGTPVLFSVDAYHLARPDFYYQWGEPHLQKLLDRFGGGLLHLHSNGRHLLEHVSKLRGLVCVYLIDEPWNPRAYDELALRKAQAGDVPLVVDCRADEFLRDLDTGRLSGGVLYNVSGLQTVSEANDLMKRVRGSRL